MKKPGEGLREIIESGQFPAFRKEDTDTYVVDLQSPRGWGKGVTGGKGFAKHYTSNDQPVYRNNREAVDAIQRAKDHGEKVEAVHSRDIC